MTFAKLALASLLSAGLVAAPAAAQAAPARAPSDMSQHEDLRGEPVVLYVALLAAAAALLFLVLDDDSFDDLDELPASP